MITRNFPRPKVIPDLPHTLDRKAPISLRSKRFVGFGSKERPNLLTPFIAL